MDKAYKKPELLAPAGSPEALYAAVEAGADAVYFGGRIGNARMSAKNFSGEDIAKGIKIAHFYGRKAFITLNTLYTNREITQKLTGADSTFLNILKFVDFVVSAGADALIVQDLGLASLIKTYIPEVELHASTQAAGYNTYGAAVLKYLGFSRMVAARELSRGDLKKLIGEAEIDIEMFIHGALCTSYSGRCYMSAAMGGNRSANRGSCAQPCRLQYNGGYPLSLKDLSLAPVFKDVLDLRPASLKIEGRMKSAGYVYGVTKIYRRLIDEYRNSDTAENKQLEALFSRQGFTSGYFNNKLGKSMYGVRTDENITNSKIFQRASVVINEHKISVEEIKVKEHFTGVVLNSGKKHRRNFKYRLKFSDVKLLRDLLPFIYEHLDNTEHIFIPSSAFSEFVNKINTNIGDKIGLIVPPVIKDIEAERETGRISDIITKYGVKDILIDNIGDINIFRNIGGERFNLHLDYGYNITNNFTLDTLKDFGISSAVLSFELNFAQIRDIADRTESKVGIIAYGRTPLMLMENCLMFNCGKCNKNNSGNCPKFYLRDRKGEDFPVVAVENHRNYVLNSAPAYLADKKKDIKALNLSFVSLNFTTESKAEAEKILRDYYLREDNFTKEQNEYPKKFTRLYK